MNFIRKKIGGFNKHICHKLWKLPRSGLYIIEFFEEKVRRPSRQFATSFINYLKLDHVSFDFKRKKSMEGNVLSFERQGQHNS